MTIAQAIIEAGFARSTASDAGKLAVDGELINNVNRKFQAVYAMAAVHQPDNFLATAVLTLAGSPPAAALATDIIDIQRIEGLTGTVAAGTKIEQTTAREKSRTWLLTPAVYRKGNSIVSVGRAGDPIATDTLTIFYLDAPVALSALATALDARFPVRFENLLVLDTAIYLSIKDEGRDPNRIAALKREYEDEYDMFLRAIGASNTARSVVNPTVPSSAAPALSTLVKP